MNRKSSTPTIINTAEITTVLKKHTNDTTNNFPSFSDFSRLAMEEAIVKIKGIIAVKSKFKNISPNGFITSTSSPKPDPVYYLQ
jgi:hypothetical protein